MAMATIDGCTLSYELIGKSGQPWVITPGGRFSKESPGVVELADALAAGGRRVLIWDRPNCGESDVRFDGRTESDMQLTPWPDCSDSSIWHRPSSWVVPEARGCPC